MMLAMHHAPRNEGTAAKKGRCGESNCDGIGKRRTITDGRINNRYPPFLSLGC